MITRDKYIAAQLFGNFRFRYAWIERFGEYNHQHLFIIGERTDKAGIPVIEEIIRGQKPAQLRIWYVDIEAPEQNRYLKNIPYEYPLPISPVAIAYDGSKYLYVIYNKYNIWRLNLKAVLDDPSGSYWFRLPPCLDCNFLGDSRMSPDWRTYFIKPNYLALISTDGLMARMDTETFAWFFDKATPPKMPVTTPTPTTQTIGDKNIQTMLTKVAPKLQDILGLSSTDTSKILSSLNNVNPNIIATGLDNDEVYLVRFGGIGGKVMNVYDRQWDNFYFDTRVCKDVLKYLLPSVSEHLHPMFIKRRRLYTTNAPGHLFYAWLRINGLFDVEYQLNDFYQVDEVRIYADYTVLQQWQQVEVQVFGIKSGWITIPQDNMTSIINETDWLWDSEYTRQYVKIIPTPEGQLKYSYSKCPPNYIKVDLTSIGEPISKIRVRYKPLESEVNYIARINKVEAITTQQTLNVYETADSTTPLEIIKLEPIQTGQEYSQEFAVYVKNTGDYPVTDVIAYVMDNQWLEMTLDDSNPDSWIRYNQDNPLQLGTLNPGDVVKFYIRGVNIDERPHIQDLVVLGVYPYKTS
jgi:hypothetical protein